MEAKNININTNVKTETKTSNQTKTKTKSKSKSKPKSKPKSKSETKIQIETKGKIKTVVDNDSDELIVNEVDSDVISDNVSDEVENQTNRLEKVNLMDFNLEEEMRKDSEEPILQEDIFRLAIKPIDPKYQLVWDLYKKQQEAFWTAEEIDFSGDRHDFMKLDKDTQHFIKRVLAFFAGADSVVNINIKTNFSKITVKEIDVTYAYQQMMENIHGEVYADMLINIIMDTQERNSLMNAFKEVGSIKLMIDWAQKWINSGRRMAFLIAAFCIFEGLMFSGAFAAIYWLKHRIGENKMKGLIQSNDAIARDEGLHTNFGCLVYSYMLHKLTQAEIALLITEAVDVCKEFTVDAIRVDLIGMNVKLMHEYIEYVSDRLVVALGYEKIFNTPIPDQFQFMDTIGFLNKENFFEKRVTAYQKAYNDRNTGNWKFNILSEY